MRTAECRCEATRTGVILYLFIEKFLGQMVSANQQPSFGFRAPWPHSPNPFAARFALQNGIVMGATCSVDTGTLPATPMDTPSPTPRAKAEPAEPPLAWSMLSLFLTPGQRIALAALLDHEPHVLAPGDSLFDVADKSDGLYLIETGSLLLAASNSATGDLSALARHGGDVCGEDGVSLPLHARGYVAKAGSHGARLWWMPGAEYRLFCAAHPLAAVRLAPLWHRASWLTNIVATAAGMPAAMKHPSVAGQWRLEFVTRGTVLADPVFPHYRLLIVVAGAVRLRNQAAATADYFTMLRPLAPVDTPVDSTMGGCGEGEVIKADTSESCYIGASSWVRQVKSRSSLLIWIGLVGRLVGWLFCLACV